eukprot:TRINITY_DN8133_c0_g2_i1.p1 TRINITY_DN8133_c0_g2~~TRINITY_DN8133_c0_g2_i1.p1  ORF type:complete len:447 (+),score=130.72 TRINITY_DN8133_c0_g2_i1:81-1343(+)
MRTPPAAPPPGSPSPGWSSPSGGPYVITTVTSMASPSGGVQAQRAHASPDRGPLCYAPGALSPTAGDQCASPRSLSQGSWSYTRQAVATVTTSAPPGYGSPRMLQQAHSPRSVQGAAMPVDVLVVRPGWEQLGIRLTDSMLLAAVGPGTPAERAGLGAFIGYRLTHVCWRDVGTIDEAISASPPSGNVPLRLVRATGAAGAVAAQPPQQRPPSPAQPAAAAAEVVMTKLPSEAMGTTWSEGLLLEQITPGSPADRCALDRFVGCRLTHINGNPVRDADDVLAQRVVPDSAGQLQITLRFAVPQPQASPPPPLSPQQRQQQQQPVTPPAASADGDAVAALQRELAASRGELAQLRQQLAAEVQRREAAEAAEAATGGSVRTVTGEAPRSPGPGDPLRALPIGLRLLVASARGSQVARLPVH